MTYNIQADRGLTLTDDPVRWQPVPQGGTLKWRRKVSNPRGDGGYDALLHKS